MNSNGAEDDTAAAGGGAQDKRGRGGRGAQTRVKKSWR